LGGSLKRSLGMVLLYDGTIAKAYGLDAATQSIKQDQHGDD